RRAPRARRDLRARRGPALRPPSDERPRRYGIDVRTTAPPAVSRASFSTDDPARLSPGQVWAHARSWTPEECDSYARTAC
ncbi:hypothetical protein, partial [Kitasatospora putterlickiae]|uniref:hypothetical protein n=1 Tax=Kitasatospora putterlickiae TaxID=221725 RepID=UPI0031D8CC90